MKISDSWIYGVFHPNVKSLAQIINMRQPSHGEGCLDLHLHLKQCFFWVFSFSFSPCNPTWKVAFFFFIVSYIVFPRTFVNVPIICCKIFPIFLIKTQRNKRWLTTENNHWTSWLKNWSNNNCRECVALVCS